MLDKKWTKMFGLGLARTGTSSLAHAFSLLGFSAAHLPGNIKKIDTCDFSDDVSVVMRFRWLDEQYPGSKFILTVREKKEWLNQCQKFFSLKPFPPGLKTRRWVFWVHRRVYGTHWFDREIWADAYDRHHAYVRWYFRNRPEDLLEMNICAGQGWERLCPFVGIDVPTIRFPHVYPLKTAERMFNRAR